MGDEVGVENGYVDAVGDRQPVRQRAGFVALPVGPTDDLDIDSIAPQTLSNIIDQLAGVIGAVVQDLYFVAVFRVLEGRDRVDNALRDVGLVVDGDLARDHGEIGAVMRGVIRLNHTLL